MQDQREPGVAGRKLVLKTCDGVPAPLAQWAAGLGLLMAALAAAVVARRLRAPHPAA